MIKSSHARVAETPCQTLHSKESPRRDARPPKTAAPMLPAWTASTIIWIIHMILATTPLLMGKRQGCSKCGICTEPANEHVQS